jgi:predicted porin
LIPETKEILSMKKSVIAVAVAAALPAFAQAASNVQLYGSIDANVGIVDNGTTSRTVFGDSGLMTNRFGVKGTEDLGKGLSALFVIETAYKGDNPNDSANTTRLGDRSVYAGLQGGFGKVTVGRNYTPYFSTLCSSDGMNGCTGVMTTLGMGSSSGLGTTGSVRASNAIRFDSANYGGLTFAAMWSAGAENFTAPKSDSEQTSLNVGYKAGGLMVGAAYDNITAASGDAKRTVVVAGYDFKVAKISGHTAQYKQGSTNNRTTAATVVVPMGPGFLKATYGMGTNKAASLDQSIWGVGYEYVLSKRTSLYAIYGAKTEERAAASDKDTSTAMVGVRHKF